MYTRYTKCISSNFVNIIFYEVFHVQIRWVVKRFKLVSYLCSPFVLIYLIGTCAKFTEKLTFLTAWYAHVHVRVSCKNNSFSENFAFPWDWGQINIKVGAKHVLNQKSANSTLKCISEIYSG